MKIHAYVLAADPTWLRPSLLAYYDHVDKIVVSYDERSLGWTGAPIQVDQCLQELRALDVESKIVYVPGEFGPEANSPGDPLARETQQRNVALAEAGPGAEWVLQIDTDEVLRDWQPFLNALKLAEQLGLSSVEWPMRVLYRRLRDGRFLEVVKSGHTHFEYPGPVAVRPEVVLSNCRRSAEPFLRPLVVGDRVSLQAQRPAELGEHRVEMVSEQDAIWHNSWARPPASVRAKIASWGHNQGWRSWRYYYRTWLPSPLLWRGMRDFHPMYPSLWPALHPAPNVPFDLDERR